MYCRFCVANLLVAVGANADALTNGIIGFNVNVGTAIAQSSYGRLWLCVNST